MQSDMHATARKDRSDSLRKRQEKRLRMEESEMTGVKKELESRLLGDLANIVLEYSPTFWLRDHGEATERAKFWAHQLRWWVRHPHPQIPRHPQPEFEQFDLHDCHKADWLKIRRWLPVRWETLTYWELLAHLRNCSYNEPKRRCC